MREKYEELYADIYIRIRQYAPYLRINNNTYDNEFKLCKD